MIRGCWGEEGRWAGGRGLSRISSLRRCRSRSVIALLFFYSWEGGWRLGKGSYWSEGDCKGSIGE
jgi:hypothetical protein